MRRGVCAFLRCVLTARCVLACAVRAFWLLPHKSGRVINDAVQRRSLHRVQQLWLRRRLDRLQRSETMQAFYAAMTRPRRFWIRLASGRKTLASHLARRRPRHSSRTSPRTAPRRRAVRRWTFANKERAASAPQE